MRFLVAALVLLALLALLVPTGSPAPAAGADSPAHDIAAGRAAYDTNDYAAALDLLEPPARDGDAEAQFLVAMMHSNGFGVPQDRTEAARWYIRAARQGHPVAQLHLGFFHRRGYGVPEDRVMSHMWTALSAHFGHTEAAAWRDKVALEMSAEEIELAEKLATQWLERFGKLH